MHTIDSIGSALARAASQLAAVTDVTRLEAELLLCAVLECPRTFLLAHPEAVLTPAQAARYAVMVTRRSVHAPLPYIVGHIEFYGLDFVVSPAVLIPRPETELLVELALERLRQCPTATWADVGTGSGCIAVTLARHAPTSRGIAVDLSATALPIARVNATRHNVMERITWVQGDMLAAVVAPVDILVSNPPYVTDAEWRCLPPSVQQEPRCALTAGADGLSIIRRLLEQATLRLRPDGLLLVEIGERQSDAAQALAQAAFPNGTVDVVRDLASKPRVLRVKRSDMSEGNWSHSPLPELECASGKRRRDVSFAACGNDLSQIRPG